MEITDVKDCVQIYVTFRTVTTGRNSKTFERERKKDGEKGKIKKKRSESCSAETYSGPLFIRNFIWFWLFLFYYIYFGMRSRKMHGVKRDALLPGPHQKTATGEASSGTGACGSMCIRPRWIYYFASIYYYIFGFWFFLSYWLLRVQSGGIRFRTERAGTAVFHKIRTDSLANFLFFLSFVVIHRWFGILSQPLCAHLKLLLIFFIFFLFLSPVFAVFFALAFSCRAWSGRPFFF